MATIADVFFKALLDDKQLQVDAVKVGNKAGASLGGGMSDNLKRTLGGAAIGAGVAAGLNTAVIAGAEFEDQLRTINTVAGKSDEELAKIGDDIQALSRETGKGTDDLTSGFYDLVSAGVAADDAIGVLRDSAKFATGALGSTAESVDLVTSVMNAYGLEAKDSARITDVFAKAVQDGKVTAAELGQSIARIAPIASSAGIEMEEVSAGFALLTAKGVPAAEAATQMRGAIQALIKPNEDLNRIQEQTGINFAELAREKGLAVALEELRKATAGSADGFVRALGNVEAFGFGLASTGENAGAFGVQIEETLGAAGIAQAQYDEKSKSSVEQGKRLAAMFDTLIQDVGGAAQGIAPLLLAVNQIGPAFGLGARAVTGFGAAIGGLAGRLAAPIAKLGGTIGAKLAAAIGIKLASSKAISSAVEGLGTTAGPGATAAGKNLGGLMGKGMSLGILAVGTVAIYEAQKAQMGAIETKVAKDFADFTATLGDKELRDLQSRLEESVASPLGQLQTGISGLFGQKGIQQELDQVNAQIEARTAATQLTAEKFGERTAAAAAAGLAGGAATVEAGAEAMVDGVPEAIGGIADEAKAAAGEIPGGIADGIQADRDVVTSAFEQLKSDMKNALSPAKEMARTIGILTSEALAKGLKSKDPVVRARAEEVREVAEARLAELRAGGTKIGKAAGENLADGLKSKNPDVKAAAQRTKELVTQPLQNLAAAADNYGTRTGNAYASGLRATSENIKRAAQRALLGAQRVLTATSPPGPDSPLHEIDVWGTRTGDTFGTGLADGIRASVRNVQQAVGTLAKPLAMTPAGAAGVRAPAVPGMDGRLPGLVGTVGPTGEVYNINVPIDGLVKATDPLEVAGQLRRLADLGTLAPKNPRYT